jgi:Flp pilus assembly protein TadG
VVICRAWSKCTKELIMFLPEPENRRFAFSPGFRTRRAAAALELAILLPLITFLFLLAVDFARIFYYSHVIENCARKGALYASDPKAPSFQLYANVQQAALDSDAASLNPQPTVTSTSGTDAAGNPFISVTVTWQFQTVTGFPGLPNPVTLSRTVQMRSAP